jgi:hypothetical protein
MRVARGSIPAQKNKTQKKKKKRTFPGIEIKKKKVYALKVN